MPRRRHRVMLSTVGPLVAALTLFAAPAQAINSYNAQPAPERTEVGAFLALYDRDGDGTVDRFDWFCSGTMISSDVYLTAAHCTVDWPAGTRFYVSLDQDVQSELDYAASLGLSSQAEANWFVAHGHAVEGDAHWDPAYGHDEANPHDVAVVDFSGRAVTPADVWSFTPATLPTANELSILGSPELDADAWTVVGYGTEEATTPGPQTHPGGGVRLKAPLGFDSLTKSWVHLAMNESRGFGGACYGDSGGPNFVTVNGQLILAATTVTGDAPCFATNVVYRMDTPTARNFLANYVTVP
jgi:Trypsin